MQAQKGSQSTSSNCTFRSKDCNWETLWNHLCSMHAHKWIDSCDSSKIKITAKSAQEVVAKYQHTKARIHQFRQESPQALFKRKHLWCDCQIYCGRWSVVLLSTCEGSNISDHLLTQAINVIECPTAAGYFLDASRGAPRVDIPHHPPFGRG